MESSAVCLLVPRLHLAKRSGGDRRCPGRQPDVHLVRAVSWAAPFHCRAMTIHCPYAVLSLSSIDLSLPSYPALPLSAMDLSLPFHTGRPQR